MNSIGIPNQERYLQLSPTTSYCFLSVFGLLFIAIGLLVGAFWLNMLCLPAIVVLAMAFYRFFYIRLTLYILTAETLKIRTGIFSYTLVTLELYRVKDYVIKQNLIMRILKIMTLTLFTTDKQDVVIALNGIPQSNLNDTIRDLVQRARAKSKIIEIN
ncbi:membrane protein YdbS, contains bPH2 (pleckstrin homology) domain [Pedobacter terrae]|uniref:Membrane protein YdbS, contains bPH2 (Pleckstrin homology) domain n=2 Tax=Pedobacter terrae TaxID=405671 RepID=A0A1G8D5X7_9SPHI|nr:membrane protein YdbS, contains bPH2 (pleckstrin homology) domain [Pedobacter terrae]